MKPLEPTAMSIDSTPAGLNPAEPEHLFTEAMKLTPVVREELAMRLLSTCEGSSPPTLDPAWDAEIARRVEDMVSGRVEGIPAEEVHRKMREHLSG